MTTPCEQKKNIEDILSKVTRLWLYLFGNGTQGFDDEYRRMRAVVFGDKEAGFEGIVSTMQSMKKRQTRHTIILAILIFSPEAIDKVAPHVIKLFL